MDLEYNEFDSQSEYIENDPIYEPCFDIFLNLDSKNENQIHDSESNDSYIETMTFKDFCKSLDNIIDPSKSIDITCKMYLELENAFIKEFGESWNKLNRDDKRKKERILRKFYENRSIMYKNIKNEPDKFLYNVHKMILSKYLSKGINKFSNN